MKGKTAMKKGPVILLLSLVFVAGCIGQSQTGSTGYATEDVSRETGLERGFSAPPFQLEDVEQGDFTGDSLRGRPLFIFFTTTWCTPCQLGAKNLARYDAETGDNAFNVLIVFVDPGEGEEKFRQWKLSFGRDDWYIAPDNGMAENYAVQYLDTKYVLDKEGIIKWKNLEILAYERAKEVLNPLI
ncbi:MAG: TlpA family protein disulfide reductase [Candidatus Aenigmarchaeota archaeon]|nr:TlpA family protein disulfide reductase [Candidatus Aenigmarchaeota archaeon]